MDTSWILLDTPLRNYKYRHPKPGGPGTVTFYVEQPDLAIFAFIFQPTPMDTILHSPNPIKQAQCPGFIPEMDWKIGIKLP